jgi:hypothetical protein
VRVGGTLELGGRSYRLREATLTVELGPEGARFDVFADSGGERPAGLSFDSLLLPGVTAIGDLAGKVAIDPPPGLISPVPGSRSAESGRLAAIAAGAGASGGEQTARRGDAPAPATAEADEDGPDDDPELGDIESYRARRAAEGRDEATEELPELDEDALAEADAEFERAVLTPERGHWVERLRVAFGRVSGGTAELEIHTELSVIGPDGEIEERGVRAHAKLVATLEVA